MAEYTSIKQELLQLCFDTINEKIDRQTKAIKAAHQSTMDAEKSSFGDKYETDSALKQHEKEKLSIQLADSVKQKSFLEQINFNQTHDTVQSGSLVITDNNHFLFSTAIGEIKHKTTKYIALSILSPIGQAFKQKSCGDLIEFRNQSYIIKTII